MIGVDVGGLVPAWLIANRKSRALIYWSLELYFQSDSRDLVWKLLKRLEVAASKAAVAIIIQDRLRANYLIHENNLREPSVHIVPNSPAGSPVFVRGRYFHEHLGLESSQRVILYLGAIGPNFCSLELARAAAAWPEDWTLVFHDRARHTEADTYIHRVLAAGHGRVVLSSDPVPYRELDGLVSSAEVGIVVYNTELGPNFSTMAGASGKMAQYLRCGLPVVCLDLPGFKEVVDAYGCGRSVSGVEEMGQAVEWVLTRYPEMRQGAFRCYENEYEFSKFFARVVDLIANLDTLPVR
ncbi:MAG: hypothetical protein ACR2IK_00825 [Chloroflexota bacterium]